MKKSLIVSGALLAFAAGVAATAFASVKNPIQTKAYSKTVSVSLSASNSTIRYWFRNDNSRWWEGGPLMGIHAWGGSSDAYYLMTSYQNHAGGASFFYVDIPSDSTSFQVIRFASGTTVGDNQTVWDDSNTFLVNEITPNSVHWPTVEDRYITALTNSPADNPRPSAYTLREVLASYQTCDSSSKNGYGAASDLYTNWIKHYDGSLNGNWEEVALTQDYGYADYVAANKDYSAISKGAVYPTVKAKWTALAKKAGIDPSTGASSAQTVAKVGTPEDTTATTVAAVSTTAVSAIAIGSFFALKKKKIF